MELVTTVWMLCLMTNLLLYFYADTFSTRDVALLEYSRLPIVESVMINLNTKVINITFLN